MNHGSMTLFSARGQILSNPSPIFSSIPPPRQPPRPPAPNTHTHTFSSCLINGPVCFTRSRLGSLEEGQNYYLSAAARAGAPTADRILKQAAVLAQIATQPVLASPLFNMSHRGGSFLRRTTQTDFLGYCVSMSDKMYPVLGKQTCLFSPEENRGKRQHFSGEKKQPSCLWLFLSNRSADVFQHDAFTGAYR